MRPFTRADRVGGLIQKALSDILHRQIKDPRLDMATITYVKMSHDLKLARIYFTIAGGKNKKDEAAEGFKRAAGYLKRILSSQLELRYMPELEFFYDASFDYAERIDTILKSLEFKDESHH
jgi:ribosome-binding factor A